MGDMLLGGNANAGARAAPAGTSYGGINKVVGAAGAGIAVFYAVSASSITGFLCAFAVTAAALLPLVLWLNRYVKGIPCFPLFAGMYVFYYGAPFVIQHPAVEMYSDEEKFTAAMTAVLFLLLATIVWTLVARARGKMAQRCLLLPPRSYVRYHLAFLGFTVLYLINYTSGIVNIAPEYIGVIRPFVLGLSLISTFLLAYNFGSNTLTRWQRISFLTLLVMFTLIHTLGLLLISALTVLGTALAGYWLGGRTIPKVAVAVVLLFLMIFQAGKYEMRDVYAEDGYAAAVSPAQYPAYFGRWLSYGVTSIFGGSGAAPAAANADTKEIGLLARASLAHMLLLVQTQTPSPVPFVEGDSYKDIPELLLPRFLFPGKVAMSEAMQRLSAQYGLLTMDITERTSIAWGLLAEAYANFGYSGVIGLAIVIGIFFGLFARASTGYSVFSLRAIASIMLMVCIFGLESHAAAAVSTVFQSMVAVVVAGFIFARNAPNTGSEI